nr:immunoglobulin light chain junction region [Macaca mulatta]
CQQQNSYPPTF